MTYRSYVGVGRPATYYNETWGYARTFMMYDIAALQYLYGADFTANAGDTTYAWSPTTGARLVNGARAIAPGGNRDLRDHLGRRRHRHLRPSNYATGLRLDLRPGASLDLLRPPSSPGSAAGRTAGIARGNVFNALQYQGDARSLIENAVGGPGNDTITGNAARNRARRQRRRTAATAASAAAAGARPRSTAAAAPTCLIGGAGRRRFVFKPRRAAPARDAIRGFDGPGAGRRRPDRPLPASTRRAAAPATRTSSSAARPRAICG